MDNKIIYFFGADKPYGEFSNWWYNHDSKLDSCQFIFDDNRYYHMEQYMMHRKASIFNDDETANQILSNKSPRECKELGRRVENFIPEIWDKHKYTIVFEGLCEKFRQNEAIGAKLLYTGDCELVEASPYDRIWGIGYAAGPDTHLKRDSWGQNLLGKALMDVRKVLK